MTVRATPGAKVARGRRPFPSTLAPPPTPRRRPSEEALPSHRGRTYTQAASTARSSPMKSSKHFQTTWVTVWVASADTHSERKLDIDATIGQLKVRTSGRGLKPATSGRLITLDTASQAKFEPITGIPYGSQRLDLLRSDEGELVRSLEGDDSRTLRSFSVVGQSPPPRQVISEVFISLTLTTTSCWLQTGCVSGSARLGGFD